MNSQSNSTSFVAGNALEMAGICKRFPGVTALDGVSLDVPAGEVVGLIGENGAGKSTLMKILAGILRPDGGTIRIRGQFVEIRAVRDAKNQGIGIIHQELNVLDNLDIAGNVFLGREPTWGGPAKFIDQKKMDDESKLYLNRLGVKLSPRTLVRDLSTAERQLVEIARALSLNARLLIMDEPTSSLTISEAERLFEVVSDLRSQGVSIIYISHRLSEIERICDRVVALRDGKNAGTLKRDEIHHDSMVQLMVGRELNDTYVAPEAAGDVCFEIQRLRTKRYPGSEVTLTLCKGEILGLAGLVGAGRSEFAEAVFGVEPPLSGSLSLANVRLVLKSPQDAIRHGIYLIPEDRRRVGIITELTVRENVTLPSLTQYSTIGFIRKKSEFQAAEKISNELRIKCSSLETAVGTLSGGNQQKVALAKWLSLKPKVLIFDEPTRGIDVGSKAEIHQLMRVLAAQGVAILMISSDMEEILGNSDRVAVMHEGRITGILQRAECTEQAIMRLAVA